MSAETTRKRASRNRTIILNNGETGKYGERLVKVGKPVSPGDILNKTIRQDVFYVLNHLPVKFIDLAFVDPPYYLN